MKRMKLSLELIAILAVGRARRERPKGLLGHSDRPDRLPRGGPGRRAPTSVSGRSPTRRYKHASTVLTSNQGFERWGEILHDEVMAAAPFHRLLHRHHIVISLRRCAQQGYHRRGIPRLNSISSPVARLTEPVASAAV